MLIKLFPKQLLAVGVLPVLMEGLGCPSIYVFFNCFLSFFPRQLLAVGVLAVLVRAWCFPLSKSRKVSHSIFARRLLFW